MSNMPQKEKLRSIHMGAAEVLATTVDLDTVSLSHVFQDDVKVVAIQLEMEFLVNDTHLNADGVVNGIVELSRQGARSQPGTMGMVSIHTGWTAAICVGGELRRTVYLPCSGDTGWEIDEGEAVNLLTFAEWVGGGGNMSVYSTAKVFYTER